MLRRRRAPVLTRRPAAIARRRTPVLTRRPAAIARSTCGHQYVGAAIETVAGPGSPRRADQELVQKRGAGPASALTLRGEASEPALAVEVVEVTGAGDSFAAGYLAATVRGWPVRARLRLGHLLASRVIGVLDHIPPPFPASELAELSPAALDARWEVSPTGGERLHDGLSASPGTAAREDAR